jgi:hypothetical protein
MDTTRAMIATTNAGVGWNLRMVVMGFLLSSVDTTEVKIASDGPPVRRP